MHDLPGVGSNMQDHIDLFVIAECKGESTYNSYAPHKTVWPYPIPALKKGPAASSLFDPGGFWVCRPDGALADIQFHLGLGSGIEAGRRET